MQNINKDRRDAKVVKRELEDAKDHIRWAMRICSLQHRCNRYFAFEHLSGATSWEMPEVLKVSKLDRVQVAKFDDNGRFGWQDKAGAQENQTHDELT